MEVDVVSTEECAVIRLKGRFDRLARSDFLDAVERAMADAADEIRVDLGSVNYLDSTGLGLLLIVRDKANDVGKWVTLANPQGSVRNILEIARFDKLFAWI